MDTLAASSTSARCNESERHAEQSKYVGPYGSVDATNVADAPSHSTFFTRRRCLVGLTVDACGCVSLEKVSKYSSIRTEIHDVVSTDRTVVYYDIPRPKRDSVPLNRSSVAYPNTGCPPNPPS